MSRRYDQARRRICYVTGTRAEFGLMERCLRAIADHPQLQQQLIVTGSHRDQTRGNSIDVIRRAGFHIDRIIPWPSSTTPTQIARHTGRAMSDLAVTFNGLKTDIVLVTGDRVEPFAAAAAAQISGRIVAHVHGGDRALGQIDDTLRHAITKLSHLHFPATAASAARLRKLGESPDRIFRIGSPGVEGIERIAAQSSGFADLPPRQFALLVLHPTDPDAAVEQRRAQMVLNSVLKAGVPRVAVVYPNNDPGADGIIAAYDRLPPDVRAFSNLDRADYLGLLRDAAFLIGNSSSGIIEAGSFRTPVINVGDRQLGRECGREVLHLPWDARRITQACRRLWNGGHPRRTRGGNVYAGRDTAARMADILAGVPLGAEVARKYITY